MRLQALVISCFHGIESIKIKFYLVSLSLAVIAGLLVLNIYAAAPLSSPAPVSDNTTKSDLQVSGPSILSAAISESADKPVPPMGIDRHQVKLAETQLKLLLMEIVENKNAHLSEAHIEVNDTERQYHINDVVDGMPSVKLLAVNSDHIVLDNNGIAEVLYLSDLQDQLSFSNDLLPDEYDLINKTKVDDDFSGERLEQQIYEHLDEELLGYDQNI